MSKLNAIMDGKGGKNSNSATDPKASEQDDADGAKSSGKDADDVEKTEYDYLLGMNLWSLTYEKVEEIKKQFEQKEEALSVALDEADAQEAEEAAAAAQAAQGRKKRKV